MSDDAGDERPSGEGRLVSLALFSDSPADVDAVYAALEGHGHTEPWDAVWGQRYAIVTDPDGNDVSLFAPLDEQPEIERWFGYGPRMESHIAIHNLFANYALANDTGDADRVEPMFATDARFELSIAGQTAVGPFTDRDTQIAFFREAFSGQTDEQRRHVTSNFLIEDLTETSAKVTAYLFIATTEDGKARTVCTGIYDTDVELRDGAWIFTRMLIALDSGF